MDSINLKFSTGVFDIVWKKRTPIVIFIDNGGGDISLIPRLEEFVEPKIITISSFEESLKVFNDILMKEDLRRIKKEMIIQIENFPSEILCENLYIRQFFPKQNFTYNNKHYNKACANKFRKGNYRGRKL